MINDLNSVDPALFHNYGDLRKALDGMAWTRTHSLMLVTMVTSFFVWGILLVVAPLITEWPVVPRDYTSYILLASPAGLLIGNLLMGFLADRFGRRNIFMATMLIGAIGISGIIFSANAVQIIISIILAEMGFGGEETVSLVFMAELFPARYRGKVLILVSNSANIGVAVLSGVFLLTPANIYLQKLLFGIMAVAGLLIAIYARVRIPESIRWKYVSRSVAAIPKIDSRGILKFLVLLSFAITIVLTFALVTFVMGPYRFPMYVSLIAFSSGLGTSATGILAIFLIDMVSRKLLALFAYTGGFLSMTLFIPYLFFSSSLILFVVLVLINSFFSELGWASRELLQPELFDTGWRGRGIASVRGIAYGLYIASLFLLVNFSTLNYMIFATMMWSIGFIGSVVWFIRGNETGRASL